MLIHGASGGVGSFAVQIAKALGARVVGTASAANLDFVRELGADEVVDYRATPLTKLDKKFATILDAADASSFAECAALLEPRGTYVTTLPSPRLVFGMLRAVFSSKRCAVLIVKSTPRDLDQLREWFDTGKLRSTVARSYPFTELPAALEDLRSGKHRGKLAVTID